jgi:peptidoglycan/xylan/chitin deacetylase (PgdA/CDA1 family)
MTGVVSLTFDNGPVAGVTENVLDVLAAHDVTATFFAIGSKLDDPDGRALGHRIVAEGHRLGGHTWTHGVQFGLASDEVVADELARTREVVDAVGGDGLLFRPYGAGGVIDDRLMSPFGAAVLRSQGYTCVLWNVLPGDWYDPAGWVDRAVPAIEATTWPVVVLHDIAGASLGHLDRFLRHLAGSRWSQDFPDDCTPIRDGTPTTSFATLHASG